MDGRLERCRGKGQEDLQKKHVGFSSVFRVRGEAGQSEMMSEEKRKCEWVICESLMIKSRKIHL